MALILLRFSKFIAFLFGRVLGNFMNRRFSFTCTPNIDISTPLALPPGKLVVAVTRESGNWRNNVVAVKSVRMDVSKIYATSFYTLHFISGQIIFSLKLKFVAIMRCPTSDESVTEKSRNISSHEKMRLFPQLKKQSV